MYSVSSYGRMIADSVRMDAYTQALRRVIEPNSIVLDIGTGTGIFAMLACQFGARRVYAVEPDDAIQVAREAAAANGYSERIEFIQSSSTEVTLSERADVIISDLRGILPLFQHHISSIADARQRLLAPGGKLIPHRDTLWAAVVETPDLYRQHIAYSDDNNYGLDMEAGQRIAANTWHKGRVTPEQLLVEPQCWGTLAYSEVENPNISAELKWTVARAGTAHGISAWFDTVLVEGVGFSNAPGMPELIYGNAFFPWLKPVKLADGDTVSVALHANLVGEDYIWRWETRVEEQGDSSRIKADFKQSTFYGVPLSPARLRKQSTTHVPTLNESGQIDRFILSLMNGDNSVGEIARALSERFPYKFIGWPEALNRVSELSKNYSR